MSDEFSFPEEGFVLVGKIAKPHGLRGEVKIQSFSGNTEALLHYSSFVLVDKKGTLSEIYEVEKSRRQGKAIVVKLKGVEDRNGAEAIYQMGVLVNKEDLPALAENEFYWYQFIDLTVKTEDGRFLGKVHSIFSNGAQDIMVVREGEKEVLIPIVESIIKEHSEKGVVITPPPGLLEVQNGAKE